MESSKTVTIKENDTFDSYKELSNTLQHFERQERVQFWKRDCRTLQRAVGHARIAKAANPALHYYFIKYSCQHGGQAFRNKVDDDRRRRRRKGTLKQACKAEINVGLTGDGQRLYIKSVNHAHNHPIPSSAVFSSLPRQRNSNTEAKITKITMNNLKANKKLLNIETGKPGRNPVKLDTNNFNNVVKQLQEKYKCTVHVQLRENTFCNMFFQNRRMMKSFDLFPEVLFVDGTYKLLDISVYILSIENSFGLMDVVGVGVLTKNNSSSINWLIGRFKERNSKWENIQVVFTDKNNCESNVMEKELPNAENLICLNHVLQHFRKEITATSLNITNKEVLKSLDYINRLTTSKTEVQYNSLFENMINEVSHEVVTYYSQNWHHIRHKWVKCFTKKVILSNNRFITWNLKLNKVIPTQSTFSELVDKLFIVLSAKEIDSRNQYTAMILKTHTEMNLIQKKFYEYLTPFAYDKIKDNLNRIEESEINEYNFKIIGRCTFCVTKDGKFKYKISEKQCACNFYRSMGLPCKHVMSFRKFRGLDLFDPNLFNERWSRTYMQPFFDNYSTIDIDEKYEVAEQMDTDETLPVTVPQNLKAEINIVPVPDIMKSENQELKHLTDIEKLKHAQTICLSLANLCSDVSTEEFHSRMDLLLRIKTSWENNETVTLSTQDLEEAVSVEYLEDEFDSTFMDTDDMKCDTKRELL